MSLDMELMVLCTIVQIHELCDADRLVPGVNLGTRTRYRGEPGAGLSWQQMRLVLYKTAQVITIAVPFYPLQSCLIALQESRWRRGGLNPLGLGQMTRDDPHRIYKECIPYNIRYYTVYRVFTVDVFIRSHAKNDCKQYFLYTHTHMYTVIRYAHPYI